MPTTLELVVRCTEIDVNGHVNNGKFVEYLEWGREDWYERHGFPADRMQQLHAVTVVVNINLNLRRPCFQGERLRVITRPDRRGRTSFVLAQQIEKGTGEQVADARITLVTVDPSTGQSRSLPEEFAALFTLPGGANSASVEA